MATWAIGDVQGMAEPLERLLARIPLDLERDRLWFAGDLVNRGPGSLDVLRRVRDLSRRLGDSRFVAVLGNHDIYLLARALAGLGPKERDTLGPVLEAPDRDELVAWIRTWPLAFHDSGSRHLLVHAAVHPSWTVAETLAEASAIEAALRGDGARAFLRSLFRIPEERSGGGAGETARPPKPDRWDPDARGLPRLAAAAAVLTRLRCLHLDGRFADDYTGPLDELPPGVVPWWRSPDRRSSGTTVVCGHWAAIGLHREPGLLALDSGCAWGNALTAVRLEDGAVVQVPCARLE